MEDICNFISHSGMREDIEYFHFVYEASIWRLEQPFVRSSFCAYLVFRGDGILKTGKDEQKLMPGTLFFTFPYQSFRIDFSDNFSYLYISFNGPGAEKLLEKFHINKNNYIFPSFGNLTDFWMSAIRRMSPSNAETLTESVLLYTLSFIDSAQKSDKFEDILKYIQNNYTDPTISIFKIADMFFYNKKYLSSLFMKKTNMKFKDYLNELRMNHARSFINDQSLSISELALRCGFSDPLYFSKVFKKATGYTPTEYRKKQG